MAEREGFEPSVGVTPYNSLAGCHLRPLGHLSRIIPRREHGYQYYKTLTLGGGRGTRTLKGVNPAVFKTAALPIRSSPPKTFFL